jgi:RNA polymerase sigma-70 factor (ECF subfamily)
MNTAPGEVTQLLQAARAGGREAEGNLFEAVYGELHRMAARYMQTERADHTLQATALVHEAYLYLIDQGEQDWHNGAHFYGVAAQVMRRILVDYARTHRTAKRGGAQHKVSLDDADPLIVEQSDGLIELDEALSRLARFDLRQSRVVELRFFFGLSEEMTAQMLGVSSRTVRRDWTVARAWLYGELNKASAHVS